MKIKKGYVLRKIFDEYTVFSTGTDNRNEAVIIALNETAVFIWEQLEKGVNNTQKLTQAVLDNYNVDAATAQKAVDFVINKLKDTDCIE